MAAEIVEALPGNELLGWAGGQQQVLVGELAEHPVPFRPGPGGERVRIAPGRGVQQQGTVPVDSDPDGAPLLGLPDREVRSPTVICGGMAEAGRHQLATRRAWLALASSTSRPATGLVRAKSNRSVAIDHRLGQPVRDPGAQRVLRVGVVPEPDQADLGPDVADQVHRQVAAAAPRPGVDSGLSFLGKFAPEQVVERGLGDRVQAAVIGLPPGPHLGQQVARARASWSHCSPSSSMICSRRSDSLS